MNQKMPKNSVWPSKVTYGQTNLGRTDSLSNLRTENYDQTNIESKRNDDTNKRDEIKVAIYRICCQPAILRIDPNY